MLFAFQALVQHTCINFQSGFWCFFLRAIASWNSLEVLRNSNLTKSYLLQRYLISLQDSLSAYFVANLWRFITLRCKNFYVKATSKFYHVSDMAFNYWQGYVLISEIIKIISIKDQFFHGIIKPSRYRLKYEFNQK